jgi:hypothetical protein
VYVSGRRPSYDETVDKDEESRDEMAVCPPNTKRMEPIQRLSDGKPPFHDRHFGDSVISGFILSLSQNVFQEKW